MERRRNSIAPIWYFFLLAQVGCSAWGQTTLEGTSPDSILATFDNAVRVYTDIRNAIYVLDESQATLTKLDSLGRMISVWGGPGSGDAELDEPADLDPTNGLSLVVADAGNRRVKRFSGEFMFLESLTLSTEGQMSGVGDAGRPDVEPVMLDEGRPIAVRVAPDGGIFAIDQDNAVIVKWGRDRRIERVFGGFGTGGGMLEDPVALALSEDGHLYVADAGGGDLKIFDQFGTFEREIGSGRLEDVRSLKRTGSRILVVMPERIAIYDVNGGYVRDLEIQTDEPIMDVALWRGNLLVLTRRTLRCLSLG